MAGRRRYVVDGAVHRLERFRFQFRPATRRLDAGGGRDGGLLDFYHRCLPTTDAALFALQFERYWGRRIADIAVEIQDACFAGSSCPCAAPPLPADGSPTPFVALQDYRTVDVTQESRLELGSDGGQLVFPFDCANAAAVAPRVPLDDAPMSPSLTVARVGAGRHGVTAAWWSTGTAVVRLAERAVDDWTCDTAAANPVPLDGRAVTAWVTPGLNGPTWFAFSLDGPAELELLDPFTDFLLCPSCHGNGLGAGGCVSPASLVDLTKPIPIPRPASGVVVLALTGSPQTTQASQAVRLRPAP